MKAQHITDQMITDSRYQLESAQVARFVATGGADLTLADALEFWGGDLELAGWSRDPITWARAMAALKTLVRQQ